MDVTSEIRTMRKYTIRTDNRISMHDVEEKLKDLGMIKTEIYNLYCDHWTEVCFHLFRSTPRTFILDSDDDSSKTEAVLKVVMDVIEGLDDL